MVDGRLPSPKAKTNWSKGWRDLNLHPDEKTHKIDISRSTLHCAFAELKKKTDFLFKKKVHIVYYMTSIT